MSTFFRPLIDKRSALVYIDDILLLANEKHEKFELIKELHKIASRENLKLAPEKSFYMLLKVKFLGHEIGNNTIKPVPFKIDAIKRIPSPKEKKDVMQFLGSVNFYSRRILFYSIMKDNKLKPVHYLVKHEEIKYNQKNDCHPILADYGDDQFSIRINNKGEDIHIKPLDSFSFQSIVPFESKNKKKPTRNQTKSLLQQSTILNDTDNLSDDDELTQSNNIQHQNSDILKEHTLAIQYPTKSDYCNQQVPFFDPSFFKYKRYFNYFFLPEDTQITIETIKTQQKQYTVLQKVYQWVLNNERPLQIDPTIAANSFLLVYYKNFNQLYINHDTKIIHIDYPNLHDSTPNQRDKICLPFKLFHAAFNKLHAHGHSGIKISIKAFNQFYFIPYLNKWISIFIHDCIECQQKKHINQKIQTASIQTISENASIDLMYAYAHTPLDEETIKLTGFSSGDKLYAFIRGFYGLKGPPNFFTKQMSTFFRPLIDKRSALFYIDDILLLANEKHELFELIKELHKIASRENLKLAPEKSFYMLLKVKFLGHEIGNNTIKPIPSKIDAIKRIPSPKEKKDVMQFLGSVNFYSRRILFYSIMKDNQLKPVHYLVKHEEIKYNQKNDCHPILADYGDDQFSIRIKNKGEDIHIKPLDSFSFQSIVPFASKNKKNLQETKQNLSYNNRQFLMILIISVMTMN